MVMKGIDNAPIIKSATAIDMKMKLEYVLFLIMNKMTEMMSRFKMVVERIKRILIGNKIMRTREFDFDSFAKVQLLSRQLLPV